MDKLQFSKLNGNNYQIWKFKMELLLIEKELWDTISEERPAAPDADWLKRDGKARARIGLMVEDNQLCHIRKENSAKGIWTALKTHHEKSTLTSKILLLKRLCRMQMATNGNMEEHINLLLDLVNQLEALGEKLAEHLVVALLLCSLPDSYNPLITALESRDEKDLTLEMVKGKLINEYKRSNESEANSILSSEMESAVRITNRKEYNSFTCHFCNKRGHFQRDCYSYKQSQKNFENEEMKQSNVKQEKAKKVVVNDSSESEGEETLRYKCFMVRTLQLKAMKRSLDDWYIDSGTSNHISNNIQFFTKIKMETNHSVELSDGKVILAKGIGKGLVTCINDKGETQEILIRNVLYVPELEANLLSVRILVKLGLNVNFENDKCFISEDDGTIIGMGSIEENNLYKLNVKEIMLSKSSNESKMGNENAMKESNEMVSEVRNEEGETGNNSESIGETKGIALECLKMNEVTSYENENKWMKIVRNEGTSLNDNEWKEIMDVDDKIGSVKMKSLGNKEEVLLTEANAIGYDDVNCTVNEDQLAVTFPKTYLGVSQVKEI